jgi:hypothetical protein
MLTKVVQRRCERRDCSRFLIPVESGDVCQAEGCGRTLAIKRKLRRWVPLAAGGSLLAAIFLALYAGDLRSLMARAEAAARTREAGAPPLPHRPSPPAAPAPRPGPDAARSLSRGETLAESGRYEEARTELARAVAADPQNPIAWADLGAANAKTGRRQEARNAYSKALDLAPDNWLAHYNLAVLLAREGDRDGALQHLEEFFSHVGSLAEVRSRAIEDLRRDSLLRELLNDPRISALAGGAK